MKLGKPLDFTFMRHLHKVHYAKEIVEKRDISFLMNHFNQFAGFMQFPAPALFVIDYSKRTYLSWTDSIKLLIGYDAEEMLEGGLDMTIEIIQKDFFKTYNEKVFVSTLNHFKNVPQSEHSDYVISFNHRMRNTDGTWREICQRCVYITSPSTGLPLYCLGMGIDITAYKKDNRITQTIEHFNRSKNTIELIDTNYYYPFEEDALLSDREINILIQMAEGLSSKMITHNLGISENTISNHRQNMLRKTNTKNVAQLVTFAIRSQII